MSSGISSSPTRFERPAAAWSSSRERPTPGRRITYKRLRVVFHESGLDETGLVGEDDRLYAVAQVEFLEDAGDVGFRGSVADDEFGGDLGVREAARAPGALRARGRSAFRASPRNRSACAASAEIP